MTWQTLLNYCTRAVISRGFYIFYPFSHCGLYCRVVSVTDNLFTKQGNSSISGSKIRGFIIKNGFKSRVGYNGVLTVPVAVTDSRLLFVSFFCTSCHNSTKISSSWKIDTNMSIFFLFLSSRKWIIALEIIKNRNCLSPEY